MTVQVETLNGDRTHARWQSIKKWLTAIDDAMNYDPNEYADTMVRNLSKKVEQLETRVNEIEDRKITS